MSVRALVERVMFSLNRKRSYFVVNRSVNVVARFPFRRSSPLISAFRLRTISSRGYVRDVARTVSPLDGTSSRKFRNAPGDPKNRSAVFTRDDDAAAPRAENLTESP